MVIMVGRRKLKELPVPFAENVIDSPPAYNEWARTVIKDVRKHEDINYIADPGCWLYNEIGITEGKETWNQIIGQLDQLLNYET